MLGPCSNWQSVFTDPRTWLTKSLHFAYKMDFQDCHNSQIMLHLSSPFRGDKLRRVCAGHCPPISTLPLRVVVRINREGMGGWSLYSSQKAKWSPLIPGLIVKGLHGSLLQICALPQWTLTSHHFFYIFTWLFFFYWLLLVWICYYWNTRFNIWKPHETMSSWNKCIYWEVDQESCSYRGSEYKL